MRITIACVNDGDKARRTTSRQSRCRSNWSNCDQRVGRNLVRRKRLRIADEVDSPSAVGERECVIAHARAPPDVPHYDNSGAPRSVPGATSGNEGKHRAGHEAKERPYEDDLLGRATISSKFTRGAGTQKRNEKVHRVRWGG
jgi:hypothetical protein